MQILYSIIPSLRSKAGKLNDFVKALDFCNVDLDNCIQLQQNKCAIVTVLYQNYLKLNEDEINETS